MRFGSAVSMALAAACALGSAQVFAQDGQAQVRAHMEALSKSSGGTFRVEGVTPSAAENIYQVELTGGELVHATAAGDGEYLLVGSLMRLKDGELVNVTEQEREQALQKARAGLLDQVAQADAIVFAPKGELKGTINVFTDVSCGFCQKLHLEVPELNAKGIAVRYLAFPRGGQRSSTYAAMQSIWCSQDRQAVMTSAKRGQVVEPQLCSSDAVDQQYLLGMQMGVTGTPAIFLEDGRLIPGYRDAKTLTKILGVK